MIEKFFSDRRGNFAMMTAILMVPLMTAAGMAVDYSNLSRLKGSLQNSNDAAALMAAEYYNEHGSLPDRAAIEKKLHANLHSQANLDELHVDGDNVLLTSTATTHLLFGGILPEKMTDVKVLSAVKVHGGQDLDVVLVLDNTYSMVGEGKLDALKVAANDFVHTLLSLNTDGNDSVRIGIVPFSNYVNVGVANRNAKWMWVLPDMSGSQNIAGGSYQQCQATTTDYNNCHSVTTYRDGIVTGTYNQCSSTCTGGYKTVTYAARTQAWSTSWDGCVGSRGPHPYNVEDAYGVRPFIGLPRFNNISVSGFPNVSCPTAITPLTADEDSLKSAIASMNAVGNDTYIAPGVMWGLRVLSKDEPYTESAASGHDDAHAQKIMVLMTDGDNTRGPQVGTTINIPADVAAYTGFTQLPNPYNENGDQGLANNTTQEACEAVKGADITVYSISFGSTVSEQGKALMQNCADKDKYSDASHVSDIDNTFRQIATGIVSVRLTQ